MPVLNEASPLGSPATFNSPSQLPAPTPSAITSEQLTTIIKPIVVSVAPIISTALANGLIAWLSAAMPAPPEIDNAQG